ncbi:flavin-containing monooxygenase, partial [Zhongshania sp.]|uniref:flavin-containing monooxygenase n=1 Tax=Zhongshania sp. TaxID=1971902 RepID=UPI003565B933
MTCKTSDVPKPTEIDIPALKRKYQQERDKRLKAKGSEAIFRPAVENQQRYAIDPHQARIDRKPITEELDVVVLGAGFSGILASYHLMQAGVQNIRNIDQAGDFGGVWYWNRYPGIQCDNDAYCYLPLLEETGFIPSKKFSDGAEIYQYCRSLAAQFGFRDKALFHTLITALRWDKASNRWQIKTNRGDTLRAKFVIMACGVLNMPKLPSIPGIDEYRGEMFHTARWNYNYTGGSYTQPALNKLTDKRVAIVGTGATAIQAIPALAKYAKQLYVVQRTPSSVDERPNPPTDPAWMQGLEPGWQAARKANFQRAAMEAFLPGEPDLVCDIWTEVSRNLASELADEGWPALASEEFVARREIVDFQVMERLRRRVDTLVNDPETAEALKPYYRFLCKRPLSNNDYYACFNQSNVELVDVSGSQGLEQMTETGFVSNGTEYPVDCMIFASGFEVSSELERRWGIDVIAGRDGKSLYDHWRGGPLTLHGTMTHGFPNQFFIGYIQGGLNATTTEQFGRQAYHISYIVAEALQRGLKTVEPSLEAQI